MKDKPKSLAYFQQALGSSSPNQRPAILLALYQQSTEREDKEQLLTQCVELIISNNLHPDSSQPEGNLGLTVTIFYNLLRETYLLSRQLFDRLFAFASTLEELKASGTAILLRLAYISAGTRDFNAAIRMARDITETSVPGLVLNKEAEFQSYRLLCLLCKGKERQRYQLKYIECLKSGYEPRIIDSIDLEIFVDLANKFIQSQKPNDALAYLALAKQYKLLLPRDQIAEFAAVHFYEMLAYKTAGLRSKLKQASHETLTFLESLTGPPTAPRLINAESLESVEAFARNQLEPEIDLVTTPLPVRSAHKYGRNEKISVRYHDGTIKRDVKFKKVESDLAENRCILVDT
jgi:hypothetical protein